MTWAIEDRVKDTVGANETERSAIKTVKSPMEIHEKQ